MKAIFEIFEHTIIITAFVFVMMLIIEYINIQTKGAWHKKLASAKWTQYLVAAIFGALPGDLGAFIMVTLYSHRLVSFGALLTTLIVSTGDAAYVMLAIMPRESFILIGVLILIGIPSGILSDILLKNFRNKKLYECNELQNAVEESCVCYPKGEILSQWKSCSIARGVLTLALLTVIGFHLIGNGEHNDWNWIRITILLTTGVALFIVATVPDHFLEHHLWKHIALKHIPQIFIWTFGALTLVHFVVEYSGLEQFIRESQFLLGIAGITSLIPSSGPQLIFVTMYSKGIIPASILLTSSIIMDCHGSLPLLAYSLRDFIIIKVIKLAIGMSIGYLLLSLGY